jgi:hypothetical protein
MLYDKRIKSLKEELQKNKDLHVEIERLAPFFETMGQPEHVFMFRKFVKKAIYLQTQLLEYPQSLLLAYSTLRYFLETLIHAVLISNEKDYIYKLYYAIYNHQVNKAENFLLRLQKEIELIAKYKKLEEEKEVEVKGKDEASILAFIEEGKKVDAEIDALAEEEFTIFFGDYQANGYSFQKHIMETELLNIHQSRLKHLQELQHAQAKKILKDKRISSLFNFKNQSSQVFKQLKEARPWNKRSEDAGLKEEYELIYEISSAILHSTSYSLITSHDTTEQDQIFAIDLVIKYSQKIRKLLQSSLELHRWSKLNVVKIKDPEQS